METLTLTAAIVPPSITSYRVSLLQLDWDGAAITIRLRGPNNEQREHIYSGSTATTLMNQLNTLNMSTTSLHKRLLQRLVSDGVLAGTVTGSPD